MHPLFAVIGLSLLAGAAIPLGGCFARMEKIQPQWLETEFRHFVIAFGGGALVSAVALVLVPEGAVYLPVGWVVVWFALGGLAMMGLDIWLAKSRMAASNLVATLSDFLPEAVALGAALGSGGQGGALLALLIALQNLPEGFNSYREMMDAGTLSSGAILASFAGLAFLGPVCALLGYLLLSDAQGVVGGLSLFAAGGILYIVFGDVAPQAKLEKAWLPPLGAVLGFLLGLVGQMLTGG
ncbi:divalent cation transporter [Coraliomargarita parva]|uniref:ZIP family metal transporter n=1 Tax=Coraliomargarita parva TaxID=3014050 RepID=UPI0031F31B19